MRRRDFIRVVAGSAAVWPLVARAQQPAIPVIGYLSYTSAEDEAAAFLPPSARDCAKSATSRGKTSRSNIAGPNFNMNAWRRWLPIWSGIQ